MTEERFREAPTFRQFLAEVEKNRDLWRGVYDRVELPEDVVAAARDLPGEWRLAVLAEDWCGDAVNLVPVVARLAEAVGWDLRVFGREANPDLMDGHLTDGRSRSIPVVILYDERFVERGWWGPRPRELQSWVMSEGLSLPSEERYRVVRRWYAKDRGLTTLKELLELFAARV